MKILDRIISKNGDGRRITIEQVDANHIGTDTDDKGYIYRVDHSLGTEFFRTEAAASGYVAEHF